MTLSYHSYGDINVPDYREPLCTFISQQVVSLCSAFWNITRPQGYLLTNIATESQTSLWTLLEAYLFYPLTCPGLYGPWAHNPQIWRMSLLLVILILYCVDMQFRFALQNNSQLFTSLFYNSDFAAALNPESFLWWKLKKMISVKRFYP